MRWMAIPAIALELGVTESVVRKWIREGRIAAVRPGGKLLRIEKEELDRFLRDARVRASSAGEDQNAEPAADSPRPGRG